MSDAPPQQKKPRTPQAPSGSNFVRAIIEADLASGKYATRTWAPGAVNLAAVMTELRRQLPADTVVANGAGNFSGWIQRYWQYGGLRSQLGPTNGAMGYGVPAGVAAKLAFPQRTVVVSRPAISPVSSRHNWVIFAVEMGRTLGGVR